MEDTGEALCVTEGILLQIIEEMYTPHGLVLVS